MQQRTTRVYRVKAVAQMFDVSVATIYRAIETGQLRALKLGTGRGTIRVPESALEAFAQACGRARNEEHGDHEPCFYRLADHEQASASEGGAR